MTVDRDGRSFSARRVSALQNGEVIFDLTASFHVAESGGDYAVPTRSDIAAPEHCVVEHFGHNFPLAEARIVSPARRDANGILLSTTMWLRVRANSATTA